MQGLLRLSKGIDAFTELTGRITYWLVPLVLGVGVWNVFNRYIGRAIGKSLGSNVFIEAQWYIFAVIFFLGGAYALKHGEHVRVDVLYGGWPPKRKALIDLLGTLLFLIPFCALFIYFSYPTVRQSWGFLPNGKQIPWEMSPDPGGLPRAPLKTFLMISPALLIIQAISEAIKNIAILRDYIDPTTLIEEHKTAL
ncbi:TRAP transporter small permease subunit [Chloroflexales bacterium ZM16-3]|nr:TRAP transporter small permease subunit [Chloroflexales bacterium ZM16-3]